MEDLTALMQEPAIDEVHVEEGLCLLVGLLAAHDEPGTRDRAARDLTARNQSRGHEHPLPTNPASPNPAAQAMAVYLREHASETVRLEEVAAAAGLDKYRALRTFTATKRIFAWGLLFMIPAIPLAGPFPATAIVEPLVAANLLFLGLLASAACFAT